MKRLMLGLLVVSQFLFWTPQIHADYPCPGIDSILRPLGYQQLTVSTAAVGLTLPTTGTPRLAWITVETNAIRYRDDGTNPSATVGYPVAAAASFPLCASSLSPFRAIRQTADGALSILYYGD